MDKKIPAHRFEDLDAWQEARQLANCIYRVTKSGTFSRDFPLRDQIRKSAISVVCNIAEGFERFNPREFRHFLSISKASCAELRTQVYLAFDQGYLDAASLDELMDQSDKIGRQLSNLMRYLKNQPQKSDTKTPNAERGTRNETHRDPVM